MPLVSWYPIKDAPRDGSLVYVRAGEGFGPHKMRWDPEATNWIVGSHKGLWVAEDKSFTWDESRGAGPEEWTRIQ